MANLLYLGPVLLVAHLCNLVLLAWLPHFLLHQTLLGVPLYKIHLYSHHQPKSKQSLPIACAEHGLWLGVVGGVLGAYALLLPPGVAAVFVGEGVLWGSLTYLLHAAFDQPAPWLGRYDWFHTARDLHRLHHQCSSADTFAHSKNYSFGGFGLHGHLADRLLGTFQPLPRPYPRASHD